MKFERRIEKGGREGFTNGYLVREKTDVGDWHLITESEVKYDGGYVIMGQLFYQLQFFTFKIRQ